MAAWSAWIVKSAGLIFVGLALLFLIDGAIGCWEQFRRLRSCSDLDLRLAGLPAFRSVYVVRVEG